MQVSANYANGQDVLDFNAAMLPGAVSAAWSPGTGTLTFSGTATLAEYEALLRSVTYQNTSDTPSGAARTVTFTLNDGAATASASRQVTVTAVNDAPTVGLIADQSIPQGSSAGPIAFTVGDVESAPATLVVTAASSNSALLPNGNITLGGSGANRTISFTPLASQYGSATITVSVFDGTDTTLQSFDLTVVPPNLPPLVSVTTLSVTENAANGTAVGTVGAVDPDPEKSFSKIYWTDYFDNQIRRANLDGSGIGDVDQRPERPGRDRDRLPRRQAVLRGYRQQSDLPCEPGRQRPAGHRDVRAERPRSRSRWTPPTASCTGPTRAPPRSSALISTAPVCRTC